MIGYFPSFYPDELLYSAIARFGERMKYPSKRSIVKDLFESDRVQAIVDLPGHLDAFVNRLPVGCIYPTADELIDNHTLLPFYAPFLPPERVRQIREDMRGDAKPASRM